MFYHVATQEEWRTAREQGRFTPESLGIDGYIHNCRREQILWVVERFYAGQMELVILCIAEERLAAPWREEDLDNLGQTFPHIYGPLNLEAVVDVVPLSSGAGGQIKLPGNLP